MKTQLKPVLVQSCVPYVQGLALWSIYYDTRREIFLALQDSTRATYQRSSTAYSILKKNKDEKDMSCFKHYNLRMDGPTYGAIQVFKY